MLLDTVAAVGLVAATILPLAWKWQLGVARAAAMVIPLALVWSAVVGLVGSGSAPGFLVAWVLTAVSALSFVAFRFYRDPERRPPDRDDVVVSPADGKVVYVHRSRGGELPVSAKSGRPYTLDELTKTPFEQSEAIVIGIALNFLDVHVNRAPIEGQVTLCRRHEGSFRSLRVLAAVFENERATAIIERDGFRVAVVMIASRLVRRITTCVQTGQRLACGQRIGAIRFGSQVDVVMPAAQLERVAVGPGSTVVAGESIIATLEAPVATKDASAPAAETAAGWSGGVAHRRPRG
jgi:phosphatidylserine decarboxylase